MGISENLKKGTSEMLILFLLEKEDMYGYQLAQELRLRSEGYFVMPEGSLYPTLYRLKLLVKGYASITISKSQVGTILNQSLKSTAQSISVSKRYSVRIYSRTLLCNCFNG